MTRLTAQLERYVEVATGPRGMVTLLSMGLFAVSPLPDTPVLINLAAVLGIVLLPVMRDEPLFWPALLAATLWGLIHHPLVNLDNHHILQLHWLVALSVMNLTNRRREVLAVSARWLIAVVFVAAVLWKVISPDFGDGTFMTYTASVDANVGRIVRVVGAQDTETLVANTRTLAELRQDPTTTAAPVTLEVDDDVRRAAFALTTFGLLLEAAIAAVFVLPLRGRHRRWRDRLLVAFLLTTSLALPVFVFAALLATMGLAQSAWPTRRAQVIYLGTLFVVGAASQLLPWLLD